MKAWAANLALVLGSVAVAIGLLELGLRTVPNRYRAAFEYYSGDRTFIRYESFPGGILKLIPNQSGHFHRPCVEIAPIRTNPQGFRGRPWGGEGGAVAVLGDSFIEALHVGEGQAVTDHLQALLGRPVWNVGVSGYSTWDELEAYRRWVRPHKPATVVLAVYLGNDIESNGSQGAASMAEGAAAPAAGPSPRASAPAVPAPPAPRGVELAKRLKDLLRGNFVSYLVLYDLKTMVVGLLAQATGQVAPQWALYMPETPAWTAAWDATERALARLAADVAADGARLLVVGIPEHFVTSPTGLRELQLAGGTAIPAEFEAARPMRRLAGIASHLRLDFLDLTPTFQAYVRRHSLPPPAFSYACDGHWNPLGHVIAAHDIAKALTGTEGPGVLDKAPGALIGEDAWRQIHKDGVYRNVSTAAGGRP